MFFLKNIFDFLVIIYNFNPPMRQSSLLDSFIKKNKIQQAPTSIKKQTPFKMQKFGTADKIDLESNNKIKEQIPYQQQKQQQPMQLENIPKNNFHQLINSDDFAFDGVVQHKKKRRMQLQDEDQQQQQKDQYAYQEFQPQNQLCDQPSSDSKQNKPKRKVGRPQTVIKPKKSEEEAKPKRMTISFAQLPPMTSQQAQSTEDFTDFTPEWATPEGCRDNKGRRPNHPQYDPTTLYVPPESSKNFTETMKQYWRIKSENYDKLILFKLGKFYEMFYQDALIGNRYLDLKWMGSKMHVGFPEKCLDKYSYEFVHLGLKLVIVQQLQTPEQMKERLTKDKSQGKKAQKTLQRGITQILTKGTIVSFVDENQYLPNYLITVSKHQNMVAYSLLEVGVNIIMIGLCQSIEQFKTMLFQTRPVQLVYDPDNLPFDVVQLMKQNWLNMVLTKLPNKDNIWHPMNSKNQIESLVLRGDFNMPAIFTSLEQTGGQKQRLILATLSGMFRYLKNCLKFDYIMSAVKFSFYEKEGSAMSMIMDSQALQHLEIFQTPLGEKDSLFHKIDRTKTKFGKRLLRRWLMQPLLDPFRINQRLDAVQDLQNISIDRNRVADIFSRLPDLQKIVNRLYHYSVKTIAQKAVYFQDVSSIRLRQFRQLIDHFNKCCQALQLLRKHKSKLKSQRLIRLLTLVKTQSREENEDEDKNDNDNDDNGLLPSVRQQLAQFDEYIKWEGDIPRPQKGLVESYDMLQDQLSDLKLKMQNYLDGIRMSTGLSALKYVHTKQRYEIQIPQQLQKKRLPDMIFTSKRSGYSRYVTIQSRRLVTDVQYVQHQIKQQMGLFVGYFFEQFRKNQRIWEKFISIIAEIDCLVSLSYYSFECGGIRPIFVEEGFDIKEAKHPCLNASDVIANDINLDQKIMLLTGPNMGGKSTLLRTACLMVILAQMGSYVPAQTFSCQVIDRIFTRIGASDKLQQGKSTFFIEMQETKSVLSYGTHKSLAIIDQLGRGTSTYDGMAIAYSVLMWLVQKIQCRCIFATHYHSLSKQFQNITAIKLKMMDYLLADDRIIFLYKLKDGRSEQSFGLNVAKIVRIPLRIIQIASIRSKLMQEQIDKKQKQKRLKEALLFISQ